jgi:enoyl-CoA hydratase/carnithine racemase
MSNPVIIERVGPAAVITFNRPEIRSPLSIEILESLIDTLVSLLGVERLVFTGAGDVFASGADLREIALVDGSTAREFAERGQRLMSLITTFPGHTVAAVNGYCYGGALDLSLACATRIASPNAEFCHPGANLGIMTGWGGTQRLPRLIGEAAALEMFMTAKRITADEALRIGLVDEIDVDPLSKALDHR